MKRTLIFVFIHLYLLTNTEAQLTITSAQQTGNWADYYVQNVLLGGGVVAFNATFSGCNSSLSAQLGADSLQIGEFQSSNTALTIPYGVILSSGNVSNAIGASSQVAAGPPGVSDNVGDDDLLILTGSNSINNPAVLEFDFVPQGDTVKFNYVFASDEYPVYVCSSFNDVFGFFLSGPGISGGFSNGAVNLAVVPNTSTYVAINTINNVAGGSACSGNPCPCNSAYYVDNQSNGDTNIRYNGMTVVLEARHNVICGDTYHIKMVIADLGDGYLDSGVFIEGGSFKSDIIEVNIASVNGDSTLNEGCGQAELFFTRQDTIDTSTCYLIFSGTAINGLDFTLLPDSIVLLPGVFDTTVIVQAFSDGLTEGMEYITVSALNITVCNDTIISSGTIYFYDYPELFRNVTPDSIYNCPTLDSIEIFCHVTGGGPPPYTYNWSNGLTGPDITVPLADTFGVDTFIVEIHDSCNLFSVFDTILITRNYQASPEPDILNDSLVNCIGDSVIVVAGVNHGNPPFTYLWSTGDTVESVALVINGPTQIFLTVTDVCGREAADTALINIKVPLDFQIFMDDTLIFCKGSRLFYQPGVTGGIKPYSYSWEKINKTYNDPIDTSFTINKDTTVYFSVMDDCGSSVDDNMRVLAIITAPLVASLNSEEALCSGTEFTLDPIVHGGMQPWTYNWSTGNDSDTAIVFYANTSQAVSLTVSDYCGHIDTASAFIYIPKYTGVDMLISGDRELCYGEAYEIEVIGLGGAGGYKYDWTTQNSPLATEQYQKIDSNVFLVISKQNNTHYIKVVDVCGNTAIDTLKIDLNHCLFVPNVVTPNADGLNDAFYINNVVNFEDANLKVFNRWGIKVYEAMPYLNDWVPLDVDAGTYYYILQSSHFDDIRGDLVIIKD